MWRAGPASPICYLDWGTPVVHPCESTPSRGTLSAGLGSARPLGRKALMTRKPMVLDRQGRRAPLARARDPYTGATISTESFCIWRDGSVVTGVSQFLPNRD